METENYCENIESDSIECLEIGENVEIANETSISDGDSAQNYILDDMKYEEVINSTDAQELSSNVDSAELKNEPIDLSFSKAVPAKNYILLQEPPAFATSSDMVVFNVPSNSVMCTAGRLNLNPPPKPQYMMSPSWQSVALPQAPQATNYLIPQSFMGPPAQRYPHPYAPNSYNILKSRQEILKKAKSVFSKRTRNLYHWIYPAASKHQIKKIVSNSWDAMSDDEKRIYVTHVMGTSMNNMESNPMLNPQLEHIREFPNKPQKSQVDELRNAISSITSESEIVRQPPSVPMLPVKRGRGRPRLSQLPPAVPQDFEDDPELCRELAQFTSVLNNQM